MINTSMRKDKKAIWRRNESTMIAHHLRQEVSYFSGNMNCLRYIWLIPFLVLFQPHVQSQVLHHPMNSLKERKTFVWGIDNRRTVLSNNRSMIYGGYIGMGFGKKIKLKLGISGTPFEKSNRWNRNGVSESHRFYFIYIGEELTLLSYQKIEITTYVQMGFGINYFKLSGGLAGGVAELYTGQHFIYSLELGLLPAYNIHTWLYVRLGGGYRFVFSGEGTDLNGYYIKTGIGLDIQKFKERMKHPGKRRKETDYTKI